MKAPRTLSTQHPDNVTAPIFSDSPLIQGDSEIKEAYYAFSHLNCHEQLWDCEGKQVDNYVIKKLFSQYPEYFSKNILGEDKRLLLRVPNPTVEQNEAKLLLEILESIPRSFDIAQQVQDIAPIQEIAVPMVTSEKCIIRMREYYKRFIIKRQSSSLFDGDIAISKWLGKFLPEDINVIPLLETKDALLRCAEITRNYIRHQKIKDMQRVWLARSDPALNYGSVAAVLMLKIAVSKLYDLDEGVEIAPMLGVGTAPFRGNVRPDNALDIVKGYPSVETFTLQSAFKYDYPEREVRDAIDVINETPRGKPLPIDEEKSIPLIDKLHAQYEKEIRAIAPLVQQFSVFIPPRRLRKLHIGLFGYSRGESLKLPRAIGFCATLYSLGLPPEIIGLSVLNGTDIEYLQESYPNVFLDLPYSLQYLNKDNLSHFPQIKENVMEAIKHFDFTVNEEHKEFTSKILKNFKEQDFQQLRENITKAAWIRKFLG